MKLLKFKRNYLSITTLILVLSSIFLFNTSKNENIEKSFYYPKTLEQEGQTYRLVTSTDNVQVPVPKGYVASRVTGENYVTPEYQHTSIPYKGNYTELTWSSPEGEQYPWTQDENGIWISGNQGIPNSTSTLESEEFEYVKGTILTINYTCSNGWGDYFNIYLINLTNNIEQRIVKKEYNNISSSFNYITSNFTWTMNNGETGRYIIRVIYSKNESGNSGQDSGYIKPSTYFKEDENGQTIDINQKTRIHDGGFVIYQLTDEEIEIDPIGTNVVITDTNKDIAQSTRNQYVWVPVTNTEDIVKTKMLNNGITQFGQNYIFSNTSITKETSTGSSCYSEPRLLENTDKTKFYLQRCSNLYKRESFLSNMQEDFVRMIKSINKYKGFYIGRYETGDDIEHLDGQIYGINSILFYKNPKIVRYNINVDNVTWYDSYKSLERISGKTGKYVETGMIYDSLWDYTLKWLNETDTRSYEEISKDGGTWGNYYNIYLKYKKSANETEKIKNEYMNTNTPTGGVTEIMYNGEIYSNSPTASNNIFDIASNYFEWTRARYANVYRTKRGGCFSGVSYENNVAVENGQNPYENLAYVGTRAQIYIL